MEKKEHSELHQHVALLDVPTVIEIHSTHAPAVSDTEPGLKAMVYYRIEVLVNAIRDGTSSDEEEATRELTRVLREDFDQRMQKLVMDVRSWILAMKSEKATQAVVVHDDDDVVYIGRHDAIRNPETTIDGRPKRWGCVICKAKTQYVCSHPSCQACKRSSGLFGTPLCRYASDKKKYPNKNNGFACVEIHRNRQRKEQQTGAAKQHTM